MKRAPEKDLIKDLEENIYCRLQTSKIHGVGIFAIRDIPKGKDPFKSFLPYRFVAVDADSVFKNQKIDPVVKKFAGDMYSVLDGKLYLYKGGLNGIDISFFPEPFEKTQSDCHGGWGAFYDGEENKKRRGATLRPSDVFRQFCEDMKFYEDSPAEQTRIENAVKKYGWAAEHNYWWFQYYQHWYAPTQRVIFAETYHGALFTVYIERNQEYFVVFDPLAAPEHRVSILMEYVSWIFSNTAAKKIWFQLEKSSRPEFLRSLPAAYRSNRIYYTLVSPIYDLRKFDPALPGGHYKTLRKEMHKFYREHQISVCDAKTYADRENLYAIAEHWKERRPNHERGMAGVYHHMIDANFKGTDEARIFVVDGKPAGINAGWMVPNSTRYYGSVGIHDFSVDSLGAMLYLEDMTWLKQHGYNEVDMGGSEKSLLAFKNKFCPQTFEEMVVFSVVKR